MSYEPAPLSKTAKYKKITKPLLERKRRARINRCLDELKDLMVGALEIDDDNLSKLEKADILELTVNHITKLHSPKDPAMEAKKFQAGFGQCAAEACRFIMSAPDLDAKVSQSLISHLSRLVTSQPLTIQVSERQSLSPPISPSSTASDRHHYYSDHDRSSSDAEDSYSIEAKNWSAKPMRNRPDPPETGLLTTVDQLPNNYHYNDNQRNGIRVSRAPEAKETILQKIRQHIMDKRVNEVNTNTENIYEKYPLQEDVCPVYPQHDTLDLRKVRSPAKTKEPKAEDINHIVARDTSQIADMPAPPAPALPEQCELPMDYNNLPPKKKRKMLEYQERKKHEEARRRDAFYEQKKPYLDDGPPAGADDGSAWRPW